MMRQGDYKLILRSKGENEFFDLAKDKLEEKNYYGHADYKEIITQMEKEMLVWYMQTSDTVRHLK